MLLKLLEKKQEYPLKRKKASKQMLLKMWPFQYNFQVYIARFEENSRSFHHVSLSSNKTSRKKLFLLPEIFVHPFFETRGSPP